MEKELPEPVRDRMRSEQRGLPDPNCIFPFVTDLGTNEAVDGAKVLVVDGVR